MGRAGARLAVLPSRSLYAVPLPRGGVLCLGERPLVMGILNITPDSFAGDGRLDLDAAVRAAMAMAAAGADIVDVGGESTRPGADPVDAQEEIRRVVPVVRRLAGELSIPISVDTYKADVAAAALGEGAVIVNDVSGLRYDEGLASVVARFDAALVLMHTRGRSKDMYREAEYGALLPEIVRELNESIDAASAAGVSRDRLVVDPGLGFAKRSLHSYGLLARLDEFAEALDRPVLVGPSRKSFMKAALGEKPPAERDWGTAAATTAAVLAGAHIVRVHAVAEMVQVVRVAEEIRRHARPVLERAERS